MHFLSNENDHSAAVSVLFCVNCQCPEKEPNYCRYLRVCEACSERVQSRQIAEYQTAIRQPAIDEVNQTWLSLDQVNEQLRNLQMKIDENLPKVLKRVYLLA